jgi:ribonuclease BN (tRNA processing enzyme)
MGQRKGWGHSDYESVFELGYKAGVNKLILFHHDPSRRDPEVMDIQERCEELAKVRRSDMIIKAAREDSELEL